MSLVERITWANNLEQWVQDEELWVGVFSGRWNDDLGIAGTISSDTGTAGCPRGSVVKFRNAT